MSEVNKNELNIDKSPENWTTGDEPMTSSQKSYLKTLCEETSSSFDDKLSKAEASVMIEKLRSKSDRVETSSEND